LKHIRELKPKEKTIAVLNKVDKVDKVRLLPLIQALGEADLFSEIIPLSAKTGKGVKSLAGILKNILPEGEPVFPEDMVTDRPREFMMTEYIREKIYQVCHQEIPYTVRVVMEEPGPFDHEAKTPIFRAVIHVDSKSRRGILVGKGGLMLKRIGTAARKDIQTLIGKKINLRLHVAVDAQWRENRNRVNDYLELT